MLVRRTRDRLDAEDLQHVGTSATLAGAGTYEQQKSEVAKVASKIFGSQVYPEHVIGETLKRTCEEHDLKDSNFIAALMRRIEDPSKSPPIPFKEFIADPLSIWIESTFGIMREEQDGRLVRCKPLPITGEFGAAQKLSGTTGIPIDRCEQEIKDGLLGGYSCEPKPIDGTPVFAFRLHQFISRGETVYASLEKEGDRHITVQGQQYVPGDRNRFLYPLVIAANAAKNIIASRTLKIRIQAKY